MPKHVQTHLSGIFRPRLLPTGRAVSGGGYDPDAIVFFGVTGLTDVPQKDALNALVVGLKAQGLWTKMNAIYPMLGGTAGTHAVNLRSPGTYNLTFSGGVTHSSTGVLWDGTTGYGDSGLVPTSVLTNNSTHLSYYSRTANTTNTYDIGVLSTANDQAMYICCYYSSGGSTAFSGAYDGSVGLDVAALTPAQNTASSGFYVGSRDGTAYHVLAKNGSLGTVVTTESVFGDMTAIINSVIVGGVSRLGSMFLYSNRECAFASIGAGLSAANITAFNTLVQDYQTALGRQV